MHWLSYLYQFGVGGLIFAGSLLLILKTGACDLRIKHEKTWFRALIIGYCALALAYLLWILAALHISPPAGVQ
ncbi:MAG: hypothetical protein AMJ46_03550 [Latescibacteria bacterium DG_63]|nr:MAG: hypothetical protein AMJ46_03550 [Latescibacteria bacterium DG_63]